MIILSIIWGTSYILIKKALIRFSPIQLGAVRIVLTTVFLYIIGFKTLKPISKRQWKWITISGFVGSFFPVFLFAFAETEIDSAVTSVLNSLVPLNTIIIGFAVFKIGSNKRQVIGVILGFIGTAILILKGAELNPNQNYFFAFWILIRSI